MESYLEGADDQQAFNYDVSHLEGRKLQWVFVWLQKIEEDGLPKPDT